MSISAHTIHAASEHKHLIFRRYSRATWSYRMHRMHSGWVMFGIGCAGCVGPIIMETNKISMYRTTTCTITEGISQDEGVLQGVWGRPSWRQATS